MKRIMLFLCAIVVAMMPLASRAQSELTVADGTMTTSQYSYNFAYYADELSLTQMIYPSSMLDEMTGGIVLSLKLYMTNSYSSTLTGITVKLKEVDETVPGSNGLSTNGATTVYSGPITGNTGEVLFEFDEPYIYEGGNLLVSIETDGTGSYWTTAQFYGVSQTGGFYTAYDDDYYGDDTDISNVLPKATFTYSAGGSICAKPTDLAASNTTTTSTTISWTEVEGAANYIVYLNGEEYTTTSDTELTLDDLTPNTTYTVGVATDCGESQSGIRTIMVRTPCDASVDIVAPWQADFSSADEIECWGKFDLDGDGNDWEVSDGYLVGHYGSSTVNDWIILPTMAIDEESSVVLEWDAMGTNYDDFTTYSVYISTDPDATTPNDFSTVLFTHTYSYSDIEEWSHHSVSLDDYAGERIHIAFRHHGGEDDNLALNNIGIRVADAPVVSISGADLADINQSVTFTATLVEGSESGLEFSWTSARAEAGDATIDDENDSTFTLTYTAGQYDTITLTATNDFGTATATHFVHIRNCQPIVEFTWNEGFEDEQTMECWITYNFDNGANTPWQSSTYYHSEGTNSYYSGYNASVNANSWLITPILSIPDDAEGMSFFFDYYAQAYMSDQPRMEVLISPTAQTDTASFTIQVFNLDGELDDFEQKSFSLDSYAGQSIRVAFIHRSYNDNGVFIDNLSVRLTDAPRVAIHGARVVDVDEAADFVAELTEGSQSGLSFTWSSVMATAGDATLNATDSTATIIYTAAGFDTISVVVTNDYGTHQATFAVRVRDCQTITHANLPYEENFDSYTTATELDPCWNRISLYPDYPNYPTATSYTYNGTSGNSLYFYPGNSTQPQLAVLPQFDDLSDLYVHFWGYRSNTNVRMEVGVMTDPSDASTFEMIEACAPTATSTWEEFYVSLASYTGEGRYIAFRGMCTSSYGYSFYVDDISINVLGACATEVRNLISYDRTGEGFTVSWESGFGLSDSFTLTLKDEDGATLQTISEAESPYTFTGLDAETMYEVSVDLICNDEVSGTASITTTTLCEGGLSKEVSSTTTGNSSTGTYRLPFDCYYNNSYSQTIYTANDLGNQAMSITSIAWNYTYSSPLTSYSGTIYLRHTTDSTLSNIGLPTDDDQLVYTGNFSLQQGWCTFEFDTPFIYDGTSNLVVVVMASGTYASSDNRFAAHSTWSGAARYYSSDYSQFSGTQSTTALSYRPDVRFGTCGGEIEIEQYTVSVLSSNTAMGSVSSTRSGEVNSGTSVTATATANQGYHFVNWTDAAGSVVSTANPYTFIVRNDVEIYANFEADPTQGIDDVAAANVSLQPNPATSMVRVGFEGKAIVELIDLNGKQLLRTEATDEATLDVSRLARGTYFVRVSSDSLAAVRKLVVK